MSTHHSPLGHKHTGRSSPTGAAGNAHSLKAIMQGSGIAAQSIGHCHGLQSTSSSSSGLSLGSSARLRQPHGHLAAIGFDPASAMGSDVVGPYYRHSHSGVMSVDGPPGSLSSLGSTPSTIGSGLGPYLSPRTHAKNAASRFSINFLDGQSNRGSVVSGQGSQSGAAAGLHGQGGTPSPISGTRNGAMSPYQCPSPQPSGDSEGCESEEEAGNDRSFSQSNSSMLGIRAKISPVVINSAKTLEHYMSVSKNEGSASGLANGAAAHAQSKRAFSDKGLLPRLNCIGKRGSTSVKLLGKRASEGGGDGGCVATAIRDGAGAAAGPRGYSSPGIGPSPALPPLLSNTQRRQTCTSLPPTGAVSASAAAPQHRLSLSHIGHGGSDDASQGLAHAKDAGSQQSAQARSRHVNFSGSSQEDQHRGSNAGSGAVVSIEEEGAGMGLGRHRPSLAASQQGHRLLRQFDAATTSPSSSKESGPSSGSGGGHQTTTSHKGTGGPLYATHGSAGSRLLVPAGSMKSLMVVGQGSFTGSRDGLQQSLAAASMRRQ